MKKLVSVLLSLVIIGVATPSVSAADYEVQKGDSLWKIAIENNTSVEMLMEVNELKSSLIHPKQELELPEEETAYHVVQEGDTLTHISNEYGDEVTVEKLKEWNNLSSDLIITGEQLVIDSREAEPPTVAREQSVEETEDETEHLANNEGLQDQSESVDIVEETVESEVKGKTFAVEATAYTAGCAGCSGITSTGINLNNNPHAKVIAVDPNVIPLGTRVYVEGYGYAVAGDTGGAIKGNKIDVHLPTKAEAYNWGRRTVNITLLE